MRIGGQGRESVVDEEHSGSQEVEPDAPRLRMAAAAVGALSEAELLPFVLHQVVAGLGGLGGVAHVREGDRLRLVAACGLSPDAARAWDDLPLDVAGGREDSPPRAAAARDGLPLEEAGAREELPSAARLKPGGGPPRGAIGQVFSRSVASASLEGIPPGRRSDRRSADRARAPAGCAERAHGAAGPAVRF